VAPHHNAHRRLHVEDRGGATLGPRGRCLGHGVIPDFKNKTRYIPYVSLRGQISHIATNKG